MNNNSNNCGDCGTTCSECGRPWAICKQDGGCGCNKCKDIKFCEYGRMANGCIREKQPGCPMQAVIPSVTVESIEGIKNLADCLVHVSDINTTFYIDDKHRPIITWAGPIDIPGYDMENNPNNYRDQIVTDVANQIAVIYDKSGKGYQFGLAENIDLQEQVNNKLDEMAKDGTLQSIIGEYINDGYLNDNFYIYPIRKGRYLAKTTANPDYDKTVDFPVMQGGCYVGNNHFIQARLVDSNTNRTQLQEINLETGGVIRTNILQLQHANSLTFDPKTNRLYVCSLTLSGVNTQYIYVLDYTTWNIIKTIDLSSKLEPTEGTHSISYDEKTGKFILGAELKTYNTMRFFELDANTEELTEITMTDSYGLLSGTGANNDITVYDNHLYLLKHNPNSISEWDLTTGKLIKVYNIPLITSEGWTQGECESITYSAAEKLFYLAAYNPDCSGGYYSLNAYYTFDLIHNEPLAKTFSVTGDIVKTVHVDIDSTEWNPKGTGSSKFNTIGEALQLLNLPEVAGLLVILANNKTYPYVNIYSEKVVTITPSDASTINTTVNGISVEDSNMCYVTGIIVTGIGNHDFDLRVRRSTVEITSCKLSGNHTSHIDTWHSKIRFYYLTYAGALFYCRAENEIVCLDEIPQYEALNNMPSINKPVECCTNLVSVGNTAVEATIINPEMVKKCFNMSILAYADYCYQTVEFRTQRNNGGNRNFSFVISKYLVKCQIVYDYTNNKFKFMITSAINLTNNSDATSTFKLEIVNIYVKR